MLLRARSDAQLDLLSLFTLAFKRSGLLLGVMPLLPQCNHHFLDGFTWHAFLHVLLEGAKPSLANFPGRFRTESAQQMWSLWQIAPANNSADHRHVGVAVNRQLQAEDWRGLGSPLLTPSPLF